jgi:DNA-directed RNA polymerase subunit RPC12/RpoP
MDMLKVKCKRCGNMARPAEFVLDPYYRLMVCPFCVKERKNRKSVQDEMQAMKAKKEEPVEEKKPGYDKEDTYLDRAYESKIKNTVAVEKVNDDNVKYACPKCKYKFVYNVVKKTPGRCPYCSSDISKLRY